MRIAQISDFHYTEPTWNPFRLLSKRFLGNLNWIFKRSFTFSREPFHSLPKLFEALNVDLILFAGDFTTTSRREEYALAKELVDQFSQNWIAVPGNHDHYTYWSFKKKRFYDYFPNRSPSFLGLTLKKDGIEAHKIKSLGWLIALDTARATSLYSSRGLFSKSLETHLKRVLQELPSNEKIFVLNHYPFFQNDSPRRTLERGEILQQLLAGDPRVHLYLHGHTHRHTMADLQPNGLPVVLDCGSCAEVKKASWNLLELQSDRCTVTPYKWQKKWEPQLPREILWMR